MVSELFEMQDTPRRETRPPKKRKRVLLIVLASVAAVVLLVAGGIGLYAFNLARSFDEQTKNIETAFPEEAARPAPVEGEAAQAQNILLLGSDTRGELGDDLDAVDGARADTIMVAHIPAERNAVQVLSIMRDNWVTIPGHGEAKINAALSYGGVPLMVQTVEEYIGVRIDRVAIIDFEGFEGLTDALGGVTINNEVPFNSSHMTGKTFPEGPQQVSGKEALAFVRERYAFTDGDYQRVRNQQVYMKAVLEKTLSAETLTNPARISDVFGAFAPYLTVDDGLTAQYLAGLGTGMASIRSSDVTFFTGPTSGTGMVGSQSVVFVDEGKREQLREAFRSDTLETYQPF
ncbi:LCP family protein [Herbiconiux sp. SYSU D00978]|uniref:LCP family protein n=1 Tax=Herbiconiux sp. SYSU D00978 TaxID=2812562 RepID=UPI001A957F04|nr:LCP family protein [Herbiconiux sp. SYSU D00978]